MAADVTRLGSVACADSGESATVSDDAAAADVTWLGSVACADSGDSTTVSDDAELSLSL